jgi:hypothetical protein
MKKIFLLIPLFFTCAESPILSDLVNDRIQLLFKGTYESNDSYEWNTNLYEDDSLSTIPSPLTDTVPFSDVNMYLDIAEIRLSTGTGMSEDTDPEEYWTYFSRDREVFCSSYLNYAGKELLSCNPDDSADVPAGEQNYQDFFQDGFTYPASDVPSDTYKHLGIYFRKFIIGPSLLYDSNYANPSTLAATFDNRVVYGTDLMASILNYASTDTDEEDPLMAPLERTDLSLVIPDGNDSYVLEVRVFIKNLLMNHYIESGNYLDSADTSIAPMTFVGPSDWNTNHAATDDSTAFHMGGQLIFTARVYDPENVGTIRVTSDAESIPAYKSYYAVLPAGGTFLDDDGIDVLPYAATSRVHDGVSPYDQISNLPAGDYDFYKTCDSNYRTTSGLVSGQDGFPETKVLCSSSVTVIAGENTDISLTCTCP